MTLCDSRVNGVTLKTRVAGDRSCGSYATPIGGPAEQERSSKLWLASLNEKGTWIFFDVACLALRTPDLPGENGEDAES